MSDPVEKSAPKRAPMRFRRSNTPRLDPHQAQRQGEIARFAFHLLGRDRAIEFLNSHNMELAARPLDIATASAAGSDSVKAMLSRATAFQNPEN